MFGHLEYPMLVYHPMPDEHGKRVLLKSPSKATPLSSWNQSNAVATVTPGGTLLADLNGIPFEDWLDVPTSAAAWNTVEGQCHVDEPSFHPPYGKMPAAGVAVQEADGRFWLVAPSNAFGGYTATFPKGRIEGNVSRQASAIREAYEEAGLKVRITGFLADSNRSQSYTRYYLAQRVGGHPAQMGWESQAVHLVPLAALGDFLTHPNDLPLLNIILGSK
jgi:8-oxo-dGTP pyrophosphatase MutT (NUDIX family)